MKNLFFTTLLLFSFTVFAQKTNKNMMNVKWDTKTKVVYCSDFNVTKPLIEIAKEHPIVLNHQPFFEMKDREGKPVQTFEFTAEKDGAKYGCDPSIVQTKFGTKGGGEKAPIQNWAGQTASSFRPFDPSGAVGPNHYIQMINSTTYQIYNKTGGVLVTGTFGDLWDPATDNSGDPIVLYDKTAERWFMSQFDNNTGNNEIYIAISQTNDPTGAWYTYTFSSPDFPDYLKFSAWQDGYYMTANYDQKIFAFNRTKMLAGDGSAEAVYQTFSPPQSGFFVPLPADASDGTLPGSGTPCPIFSYSDDGWGGGNVDAVNIYNATVDWGALTMNVSSAASLATNAFDGSYDSGWDDIPQPGTSQKLDGIGGAMMYRAQWKTWSGYNTTVLSWAVKVSNTQRGIFWCELRQDQGTNDWSIYQQGIYAPGTDYYWMSSIAMNDNGDIALCYAKGSDSTYMSLAYAGRSSGDTLGSMTIAEEIAQAGTSAQTGMNRVGDYAQTCLDPDGVTFWHTGEYMSSGGNAGTRVYSFQLPISSNPPVANFSADNTNVVSGQTVTFTDSSTNSPTSWSWSFSPTTVTYVGGTSSTSQNPQVTFDADADYTVTLTATNADGSDDEIKTDYIHVAPCSDPSALSANNETTTGADLSWTENGAATTWDLEIGLQGFAPTGTPTDDSITANPYTWTGGTTDTSYDFYVRSNCGSGYTSSWVGPFTFTTTSCSYCDSSFSNTSDDFISNVTLNNIDNDSDSVGYEDFTALSTDLELDNSYTVLTSVTVNGSWTEHVLVWIDWNQDCDFDDSGETYDLGQTDGTEGTHILSLSITVPATANLGTTRMRVIEKYGSDPTSCETGTYGETEDYSVNVVEAASVCVDPSDQSATNITTSGADLGWTENGSATLWDLEIGNQGFAPTGTPTDNGVNVNPFTWSGGVENTTYDFYVRSDCGGDTSAWVGPFSFTTNASGVCNDPSDLTAINLVTNGADLGWTENGAATTWDIEIGEEGFAPTGNPTDSEVAVNPYTWSGGSANTSYDYYVRAVCSATSSSVWVGPFTFTTVGCSVCPSTYSDLDDDYIDNVVFNTINNASGGPDIADSYEDFTSISTDLKQGVSYPIDVHITMNGNWTDHVFVYVDWNHDCDFNDANEAYDLGDLTNTGSVSSSILVPVNAVLGVTTMRIIEQYSSNPEACNDHGTTYGSTEDYSLNVIFGCNGPVTTWDGAAWDNGIPDVSMQAVINGDYTSSGDIEACSCTVNSAINLVVNAGDTFRVRDDFVNEGSIFVHHEGSFLQTIGTATVSGSGTFTTQKITTPYHEYDYTYFSSPSSTATIADTFDDNIENYVWSMHTANMDGIATDGDDWDQASGVMTPAVGYAVLGAAASFPFDPDTATNNNTDTVSFDGAFNTGDITTTVVIDGDLSDGFNNQNLIGNPYPSAIDLHTFYNANANVLGPNFHFWTHNTAIGAGGSGSYAYNFTNDDYSTWNAGTGAVVGGSATGKTSQFVASAQGFIAEAADLDDITPSGVVRFTNAMRVSGNNTNFLSPMSTDQNRIWLNLRGDNGDFRQLLVGFFPEASDSFEEYYDAPRMENGDNTDFYTTINGETTHYAIQGMGQFQTDKVVPLGLEIVQEGVYTIEIDRAEGLFATGQSIYIYDYLTNSSHEISNTDNYSFFTTTGTAINNRFEIRFTNSALNFEDNQLVSVQLYPNPTTGEFTVVWSNANKATIKIVDVSGKLVMKSHSIQTKDHKHSFDVSNLEKGVYFVKLSIEDRTITKKLILN